MPGDKSKYLQYLASMTFSHCECGEGTYQFQTKHGRELVLLIRDAMRKLSLKRKEQEEKLHEMRSMRRLRLSMRTESDSCLQNRLTNKRAQFRSVDNETTTRRSKEEHLNGKSPGFARFWTRSH